MENEARRFPPPRSEEKEASSRDRANSNTNNNFFERFLKLSSLREKLELVKEKAERKRKQRRGGKEKEESLCPLPNVIRVESGAGASSTSNSSLLLSRKYGERGGKTWKTAYKESVSSERS